MPARAVPARALDAFATVIARGLAAVRALAVVYALCYVVIWWPDWYGPRPWRLAGPAVMIAWSAAYVALAVRRGLTRRVVLADVTLAATLTLTAPWTLPGVSRGDPSSWVPMFALGAGIGGVCVLRTRWSLPALLALAVALFASAHAHRPQVVTATILLLFIGLSMWQAALRLRRVAVAADAWLDVAAVRTRAEAVAAARARGRRTYERFLHDTVLNELAAIDLGCVVGARDTPEQPAPAHRAPEATFRAPEATLAQVRARCGHIVTAAEDLLASTGSTTGSQLADPDAELLRLVRGVIREVAETGLEVELDVVPFGQPRWPVARPAPTPGPGTPADPLPADVVQALAAAVREALTNVRRHAGVPAAQVRVERWLDGLRVLVVDDGAGFDVLRFEPVSVPGPGEHTAAGDHAAAGDRTGPDGRVGAADRTGPGDHAGTLDPEALAGLAAAAQDGPGAGDGRLGIRRSLYGRMADVGGWAEISSAPGQGTRVELAWQAARPASPRLADSAALRRDYDRATRRAVGIAVLAGVAVLAVPAVLFRGHSAPSVAALRPLAPYASLLLWLVVAGGAGRLVALTWRRSLTGVEALAAAVFTALVVLAAAATTGAGDVLRIYNWAGIMAPTLLLLPVTASRPVRQWAAAVGLVVAATLAVDVPRISGAPLELARLLCLIYGIWGVQLLATIAGPLLRATAETTTQAAALDAALGAAQDVATAVRRDQVRRLARLDRDVLPLLRAVADGSADPRDAEVRRLCARRGRALRRMLVGSGGRAGPLAELELAMDAAEARGALVALQVDGELGTVPTPIREEIVDLVGEALRAAPPGRVTVTLWCDAGEGFLTYPEIGSSPVAAPAAHVPRVLAEPNGLVTTAESDGGDVLIELRWPPRLPRARELAPAADFALAAAS